MKKSHIVLLFIASILSVQTSKAQVDEDQLGAWYMYFFSADIEESDFGFQGDVQYRSWDLGQDLEQLLIRGGLTYKQERSNLKLTLGYANITSGEFGEGSSTSGEHRIYQEALLPAKLGYRFYFMHRARFEQRLVDNQDFRTRYRYNLFLNIPLNGTSIENNTAYLALYNEIFINGQREIGNGRTVNIFDRNRAYAGIGYQIRQGMRVQLGVMNQTTDNVSKTQYQVSFHQTF